MISDMSLKIAYMTGEYPRVTDTFVQREVVGLRARGVDVQPIAIRRPRQGDSVGGEQKAESERTVYLLPVSIWRLIWANASTLVVSPKRYFRAMVLAWRTRQAGFKGAIYQLFYFIEAAMVVLVMKKRGLVHLHNHFANSSCTVAMLASEIGGFDYSFTIHGPAIFFEPRLWRIDEKIRRAKYVCCISHFCRSQAMIFVEPRYWEKLHIVHCGVDPSKYAGAIGSESGRHVIFVGRLAAVKGLPILLDAMAKVRERGVEMELTVVGDGVDREMLEEQARELGIDGYVDFVGYQSQEEVRDYLNRSDIFAMSSFAEGVPVVLMEAMSMGLPVVAPLIAGIPELIEHGKDGYLVSPGDVDSLAVCLSELIVDKELRQRLGENGRAKVKAEFNIEREVDWLYELLVGYRDGKWCPMRKDGCGE